MKKLSSSVVFLKWVFPFIYVAVVLFIAGGLPAKDSLWAKHYIDTTFAWMPLIMIIGGLIALKLFIWPMLDEVWDTGEALVFKRGKIEVHVPYSDISRLARSEKRHDYTVTVYLKKKTPLGSKLTFYPKMKINRGIAKNPDDVFIELDKKIRTHN